MRQWNWWIVGVFILWPAVNGARGADEGKSKPTTQPSAVSQVSEGARSRPPGDLEPLRIALPKPVFAGTPRHFKITPQMRLDPAEKALYPDGRVLASTCIVPCAELMLPKGTKLVSKFKPVTMSDSDPVNGHAGLLTDGIVQPAEGNWVELPSGPQWVQVDLEADTEVWGICVWHESWPRTVYRDVIVQIADDEKFTLNVRTLFNNDQDNSTGLGIGKDFEYITSVSGKLIDGKGERARYVRCYSNGSIDDDLNHFTELSVFGKAAK